MTGINADGIRLLQTYLDMTGDIQTLALLAARLPSSYVAKAPPLEKWIQIYKDLLNQWQLFHERARFDVGRSQLEDLLNGFTSFLRDFNAEDLQAELSAPSTLSVPPQLFVRCNFLQRVAVFGQSAPPWRLALVVAEPRQAEAHVLSYVP